MVQSHDDSIQTERDMMVALDLHNRNCLINAHSDASDNLNSNVVNAKPATKHSYRDGSAKK